MEHRQTDDSLKELINNLDTVPPEVNWQKERSWYILEEKVKPLNKQKATFHWYYAIAASVFLVMSISWFAFKYIDNQDKEIAQLKQRLGEVKVPERKPELYAGTNTSDKNKLAEAKQDISAELKLLPAAQKNHIQYKKTQSENSLVKDFDTISSIVAEPALKPEEEITAATISAVKQEVHEPKSVQEIILGKVKKQHFNHSREPIIIVFPAAQEEYMARQLVEPSQKTERKNKLHNLIINNIRESAAEAYQHTGTDAYPRIKTEKAN